RNDPDFRHPALQQETCSGLTPQPTGNPDIIAGRSVVRCRQHQPYVLNQMPSACRIGFYADLEFLRQSLEPWITGKVPLQAACQGFKLRELRRPLTGTGNPAHCTATGTAGRKPDHGKLLLDCGKIVPLQPVDLHAPSGSKMDDSPSETFSNTGNDPCLLR